MNTDLISRQAVIDSLYDWSNHSMTDAETWHLKQIIGDIKSMPSVTPKPCDDAISRQAALDAIGKDVMGGLNYAGILTRLPSVTPKQRTGHWITVTNGRGGHECSLCHEYAPSYKNGDERLTKYCPNCGCRMVEPQESEVSDADNNNITRMDRD